jgi:hypothetical protein
MSPLSPYASMKAAGQGFFMGSACSTPMIVMLAASESPGVAALGAYCAAGASLGVVLVLLATLLDRWPARAPKAQPITVEVKRLTDCEARCVALQAALMACASAAGPETLHVVSTQYNMMLAYETERQRQQQPLDTRKDDRNAN